MYAHDHVHLLLFFVVKTKFFLPAKTAALVGNENGKSTVVAQESSAARNVMATFVLVVLVAAQSFF